MDPQIAVGLIIVAVTVGVCWLLFKLMVWLMEFQYDLRMYIFESKGSLLLRIPLVFVWLPLYLFCVFILIIGLLCGLKLAKDAVQWFSTKD